MDKYNTMTTLTLITHIYTLHFQTTRSTHRRRRRLTLRRPRTMLTLLQHTCHLSLTSQRLQRTCQRLQRTCPQRMHPRPTQLYQHIPISQSTTSTRRPHTATQADTRGDNGRAGSVVPCHVEQVSSRGEGSATHTTADTAQGTISRQEVGMYVQRLQTINRQLTLESIQTSSIQLNFQLRSSQNPTTSTLRSYLIRVFHTTARTFRTSTTFLPDTTATMNHLLILMVAMERASRQGHAVWIPAVSYRKLDRYAFVYVVSVHASHSIFNTVTIISLRIANASDISGKASADFGDLRESKNALDQCLACKGLLQ